MTNFLADLLGSDHPLFVRNLSELEKASGNAGVDTRLIADITESAHTIMRQLGFDTTDTRGEELYQALNAAVKNNRAETLFRDSHYVLLRFSDGPVSFCLRDVIENAHHQLSFADRTYAHAQRHLRAEVIKRYADHDRTNNDMVHQLAEEAGLKPKTDGEHASNDVIDTKEAPTMLAIGDIFTDAFIQLKEDEARIDTDEDGGKRLSIPFGSKPPYERVDIVQAVGPSPNAAVSCARLGLDVSLMAWLGDDKPGLDSLQTLHNEQIDTPLVVQQANTPSNYYYVLRYGADRTILVKNEDYRYNWKAPKAAPDWLYLSLISDASWQLHEDMLNYLDENRSTKLAFQPGTFHFKWGVEKLKKVYERSYIVVMNREEAVDVTGKSYDNLPELMTGLHDLGPEIVVVTDGPSGSYASYDDKLVQIPNFPDPGPPVDRTGAGDAFASTIVAALALGKSMDEALTWAPINSMNVVQHLGAQAGLLNHDKIAKHLSEAPDDYKVSNL